MRRVALAGILMATAAGLLSAAPAVADNVSIGVTVGTPPPPVMVTAPPQLVVVTGTPVYYAPAVSFNYFFYSGRYYVFHDGAWFYAAAFNGPWTFVALERVPRPILAVPVAYYRIPPGHWKKDGPPPWAEHAKGRKRK
jgi:hypothetical protein